MGEQVVQLKQGVGYVVDGTANTPKVVVLTWIEGTLSLPLKRDRPEEIPQVNQGVGDSYAHFVTGPDDPIVKPKEFSMELKFHSGAIGDLALSALSNPNEDSSWQPDGAATFSPVTSLGQAKNYAGTSFNLPLPADSRRTASLVNFEFLSTITGGTNFGLRLKGVFFDEHVLDHSNPTSSLKVKGTTFGTIAKITAFTSPITILT